MVCACVPIEKWGGFTNVISFDPDLTPDYDTVNRLCVARCRSLGILSRSGLGLMIQVWGLMIQVGHYRAPVFSQPNNVPICQSP